MRYTVPNMQCNAFQQGSLRSASKGQTHAVSHGQGHCWGAHRIDAVSVEQSLQSVIASGLWCFLVIRVCHSLSASLHATQVCS